jgi:hypothetical protein
MMTEKTQSAVGGSVLRGAINCAVVVLCLACASNKSSQATQSSGNQILGSTSFPGGQPTNGEPFPLNEVSDDKTYGYTEGNPITVGGSTSSGPLNERRYLNALAGPNGEPISYVRIGSCCQFKTKNALMGGIGLLDKYKLEWKGQKEPVFLYINMYDPGPMKAPLGLTVKK